MCCRATPSAAMGVSKALIMTGRHNRTTLSTVCWKTNYKLLLWIDIKSSRRMLRLKQPTSSSMTTITLSAELQSGQDIRMKLDGKIGGTHLLRSSASAVSLSPTTVQCSDAICRESQSLLTLQTSSSCSRGPSGCSWPAALLLPWDQATETLLLSRDWKIHPWCVHQSSPETLEP